MKHPTELLGELYGQQSTKKCDDSTKSRVASLWRSLTAAFGDRFTREFGDEPSREWESAASRLTDAQIVSGLTRLAEEGRAHPPNLSEFVAACQHTERPREIKSDPKLLAYHTTVDPLVSVGLHRINLGHPEHDGYICDPYSIPRPHGVGLVEHLKTTAKPELKAYCRSGIEWTRKYPQWALPGFKRLVREIAG